MAACSRTQFNLADSTEIRFQVADYRSSEAASKAPDDYKADYGSVPFGAYAWYKGENPADDTTFMTNQKVAYNASSNVWFTEGATYYWPKWGSLDFICYSPYSESGVPAVDEQSITYDSWDVAANPDVDLLYADKSTGLTENISTYYYSGVPVLFRHALAKVAFSLRLAYSEMTPATGDKTKWEVTLNSMELKDILTKGSLGLTLENGEWKLPENKVWTADTTKTSIDIDCASLEVFRDTIPQTLKESFFVLPQALDKGQKIVMNISIKTWRDTGNGYPEEPFIKETSIEMNAALSTSTVTAWSMNQNIKYNLIFAPSKSVDGLSPIEIYFDPADADWETINMDIQITI